jgi:hypothetical protein
MYMSVVLSILVLELPKNDVAGCYRRGNACATLIPGDSRQMQSLAMPRRVETVLPVPPPAALVVEGMGMGGQSGAVEKATRGPSTTYKDPFCRALRLIYLIIDFCFQISSHKSNIAVIVSPLAWVKFKYL